MKLFIPVIVLLCLSLSQDSINAFKLPSNQTMKLAHSDGKIIGGQVVDITKVPYQATLWTYNEQFLCGAVILNSRWLATAGHCIISELAYVKVGLSNKLDSSPLLELESLHVHPQFVMKYEAVYFDIALVKLKEELSFSDKVQPINLTDSGKDPVAGARTTVSGFGLNPKKNNELRLIEVPVVDFEKCDKNYNYSLNNSQFCAGVVKGDKDVYFGDSGGPIVDKDTNKVIGVVSMRINPFPSVYTNIANPSIREWIKEKTGL